MCRYIKVFLTSPKRQFTDKLKDYLYWPLQLKLYKITTYVIVIRYQASNYLNVLALVRMGWLDCGILGCQRKLMIRNFYSFSTNERASQGLNPQVRRFKGHIDALVTLVLNSHGQWKLVTIRGHISPFARYDDELLTTQEVFCSTSAFSVPLLSQFDGIAI